LELRGTGAPARRKLLPPKEERLAPSPARLRLYDGPMAGREVRLDRGPVRLSTGADATVRLDRTRYRRVRVEVRPRSDGGFEVEERSAEASLRVNGRVVSAARLGAQSDDVMLTLRSMLTLRRARAAGELEQMALGQALVWSAPPDDEGAAS
ncbi:MAG TPA: hypothetical protein VFS00_30735, partial [Polyangiaceae bacterium]|nr:hypothetical protein [Polyangiaceae bacterium]